MLGQAERYVKTVLNLIRVESNNKKSAWSDGLCKIKLVLNVTKQKTTQYSALYLLIGTNATTPVIRALVRDVAIENSSPNSEATRQTTQAAAQYMVPWTGEWCPESCSVFFDNDNSDDDDAGEPSSGPTDLAGTPSTGESHAGESHAGEEDQQSPTVVTSAPEGDNSSAAEDGSRSGEAVLAKT